jgi:hypothetical protein
MPIEPLKTDEKLPHKARAAKDMDSLMIAGCAGFVGTSLFSYFLTVWPFFVFQTTHRLDTIGTCALLGFAPAAALGVLATRRFNLPGACGFIGGSMATCVFLYLRLQQIMLGKGSPDFPQPDFPDSFVWMLPMAWLAVSVLIVVWAMPKTQDS